MAEYIPILDNQSSPAVTFSKYLFNLSIIYKAHYLIDQYSYQFSFKTLHFNYFSLPYLNTALSLSSLIISSPFTYKGEAVQTEQKTLILIDEQRIIKHNQMMRASLISFHIVFILSLLTISITAPLELSPALPPSALVGQYYSCAFRVGGLTKPRFAFSRLPPPLVGSRKGIVEGIPSASGAYRVTVSYSQQDQESSQEVMFIVALPEYNTSVIRSRNLNNTPQWRQVQVQTVFNYGDVININLYKYAPNNKYNWTYLHLPAQLKGDSTGRINGILKQEGYYTFAAICADQDGNSFDQFLTINVQPLRYEPDSFYSVPVHNTFPYNLKMIDEVYRDSAETAASKKELYLQAYDSLKKVKNMVQVCISIEQKAKTQAFITGQLMKIATQQLAKQQDVVKDIEVRLKGANGNNILKKVAYDQAYKFAKSAKKQFDNANNTFNDYKQALSNVTSQFIAAQTESSQTASVLANAQLTQQLALQDVNSTFQTVMDAKQVLQAFTSNATLLGLNVSTAQSQKEAAGFQNDAATSSFNKANDNTEKALQNLKNANSSVIEMQISLSNAKSALGQSRFNLTQAMNNLLLAQAAKQQADKTILLASSQNIQESSLNATSFAGCIIGNYPSISGTAFIVSTSQGWLKLSSGYVMVFGGCTAQDKLARQGGDVIQFEGYLRSGAIHALRMGGIGG